MDARDDVRMPVQGTARVKKNSHSVRSVQSTLSTTSSHFHTLDTVCMRSQHRKNPWRKGTCRSPISNTGFNHRTSPEANVPKWCSVAYTVLAEIRVSTKGAKPWSQKRRTRGKETGSARWRGGKCAKKAIRWRKMNGANFQGKHSSEAAKIELCTVPSFFRIRKRTTL